MKLLETYQGNPDLIWWHSIIQKTNSYESWGSRGGGRSYKSYDGWFLTDILGLHDIEFLSEINNPLVTVPRDITHPYQETEEAAFIGGIVGYVINDEDTWPRVSAVHSWTLCLETDSQYTHGSSTSWINSFLNLFN